MDRRLATPALGLRQPGGSARPQLALVHPGTERDRTYTLANRVLRRYHPAHRGAQSRAAVAVAVRAAPPPPPGEAAVWGLIRAVWPLARLLYAPASSNGTAGTPFLADAREAIAATVADSIFDAPTPGATG